MSFSQMPGNARPLPTPAKWPFLVTSAVSPRMRVGERLNVASGHAHAKRIQSVSHHPNIQPSTAAAKLLQHGRLGCRTCSRC